MFVLVLEHSTAFTVQSALIPKTHVTHGVSYMYKHDSIIDRWQMNGAIKSHFGI